MRPARAWFILSLLHAHELPSFHPGLHRWLQTMSVGSLRLNSRKHLLVMSKLLSRQRLFVRKVLGLMERICLMALVVAKMPPSVAAV
jgi:hypothetical protein